jgi:putative cell wall-binding protein
VFVRDAKTMRAITALAAVVAMVTGLNTGRALASNDPADRPIFFGLVTGDSTATEVDQFTAQAGVPPAFRMEFWTLEHDWPNAWGPNILSRFHDRGITNVVEVVTNSLTDLNSGKRDAALAGMAQSIADWVNGEPGRRLIIAPLPEPNLVAHYGGASPSAYKAGWNRIRNAILATGLDETQVRFVFWVNGLTDSDLSSYTYRDWYPGDDVVDIVGFSKLNRNTSGWWDYDTVFTRHILEMQGYVGTHKPIMVMQTGTVGGSSAKDGWLTDMMTRLPTVPQVIGTIYNNKGDFRILENGVLRPPVKNHIGSWSHPSQADWIFDGGMDAWVEWRRQWLPARIWGDDRYETSVEISQMIYPGGAAVVYLAVGTNYPDSMVAGGAAVLEQAPVLLVQPTQLPAATRAELLRLGPTKVVIVGGTGAISQGVADQVKAALPAVQIVRHSGPNRYATAVEVSKAAFPTGADTVYVVTGENFPDALSATPPAVISGGPLLLVQQDSLPAVVADELARLGPERIIIVGGVAAVSTAVEQALGAHAAVVERIDAPNRYATSAELSKRSFPNGADVAYIALGTSFPDALSGGGTGAVAQGPMLLVTKTSIPSEIVAELIRLGPSRIVVFGGPGVILQKVVNALAAYVVVGG